jgi:hypothetical protein
MKITSWIFGILNIFQVHAVPGIIYIVLSLFFFPITNTILKKRFGFSIPFSVKIILFLLIMWFTLGVGDLAEIYGL